MYNFWVHNISNLIPPTGIKIFVTSVIFFNRYPDFLLKSAHFYNKKVLSSLGT